MTRDFSITRTADHPDVVREWTGSSLTTKTPANLDFLRSVPTKKVSNGLLSFVARLFN